MVLSDGIDSQLIFEGEEYSIMSIDGMKERTILLDGFSNICDDWLADGLRRYAGRSGNPYLAVNDEFEFVHCQFYPGRRHRSAPRFAAIVVDALRAKFKKRRDVMVAGLNKIKGFSCRVPHGAFYVFPNITKTGWPSKKLADALLEDAGVAGLSGTAFGDFGEGYLRFSVANSIENIEKALDRIDAWTKKNL